MTVHICVMPRTAEFMRSKGYDEQDIRKITDLSALECERSRLLDALRSQRSERPRENDQGGAAMGGSML